MVLWPTVMKWSLREFAIDCGLVCMLLSYSNLVGVFDGVFLAGVCCLMIFHCCFIFPLLSFSSFSISILSACFIFLLTLLRCW